MDKFHQLYESLPDIITTKELSSLVAVSTSKIRSMVHSGDLKRDKSSTKHVFRFNKQYAINVIYANKIIETRKESYDKYFSYFQLLFMRAYKTNPLQSIYAILEVDGMFMGHFNPTEEMFHFFDDFNSLLSESYDKDKYRLRKHRIHLLMYCHALEMDFYQKLIMNLLRIINAENYIIRPFSHSRKNPPSLNWKIGEIKKLAGKAKEDKLVTFLNEIYIDEIRNSFYHSDYCFDDTCFRYKTKQKIGSFSHQVFIDISIHTLSELIARCFSFFEALFHTHTLFREHLATFKKYHKLPHYEVLELLVKNDLLYGFSIHFSNGSKATFEREPRSVIARNILFDKDGSVNFMIGNRSELTNEWKVNGQVLIEKKETRRDSL